MKNRSLLYLKDILDSMNKIADYTRGVDYDGFFRHPMMVDAVIRNLEVIGEASNFQFFIQVVHEDIRQQWTQRPPCGVPSSLAMTTPFTIIPA